MGDFSKLRTELRLKLRTELRFEKLLPYSNDCLRPNHWLISMTGSMPATLVEANFILES